jgi:hypothetical protein
MTKKMSRAPEPEMSRHKMISNRGRAKDLEFSGPRGRKTAEGVRVRVRLEDLLAAKGTLTGEGNPWDWSKAISLLDDLIRQAEEAEEEIREQEEFEEWLIQMAREYHQARLTGPSPADDQPERPPS